MTTLVLTRTRKGDDGTFGLLKDEDALIACTCEPPDNGNQPMGCIPVGKYTVNRFQSPTKGDDYLVRDVPNRTMIEIHKGNTVKDTEGCILVGTAFGSIAGVPAVLNSASCLAHMIDRYPAGFTLQIVED